jgi:hypothetical protein
MKEIKKINKVVFSQQAFKKHKHSNKTKKTIFTFTCALSKGTVINPSILNNLSLVSKLNSIVGENLYRSKSGCAINSKFGRNSRLRCFWFVLLFFFFFFRFVLFFFRFVFLFLCWTCFVLLDLFVFFSFELYLRQ